MGKPQTEFADFSGVNSQSSPLRLPPGAALRSRNWVVKPNGIMQLRYGYTRPPNAVGAAGIPIHSASFFELRDGTGRVLFSQGTNLVAFNVASGAQASIKVLASSNPWNGVYSDGHFLLGNANEAWDYDGNAMRPIGMRAPTDAEAAAVTVSYAAGSAGDWGTTSFSGFLLYMAYYNPQNGHVGNRIPIGVRTTVGTPSGSFVVTGLPNLAGVNPEWVKLLGRTYDGGMAPAAFADATGTWVVAGNTDTVATISSSVIDPNAELPTRNGLPPRFDKIAWALGRAYAIDEDDPTAIRYSESQQDVPSGLFVGKPPHSWPAASKVYFPTGESVRGIHAVDDEVWVWSRNHLAILTEFGTSQSTLGRPVVRWRGVWVGGIAGHRAFAKTRYGPLWMSADKQIMRRPMVATTTTAATGPEPISEEYGNLLTQIANAQVPNVELGYHFDSFRDIDCLYINGTDLLGNDVLTVHDFGNGNHASERIYSGLNINTIVRNPQQVVSMVDANGKPRLWVGDRLGQFAQLEEGDTDAGFSYSADYITVFNGGPSQPAIGGLEWFGDGLIRITYSPDLRLTLNDLDTLNSLPVIDVDRRISLWRVQIEEAMQYFYLRIQLDSHPADGTLLQSAPVSSIPVETYGRLLLVRPDVGAPRGVGGARP